MKKTKAIRGWLAKARCVNCGIWHKDATGKDGCGDTRGAHVWINPSMISSRETDMGRWLTRNFKED